MLEIKNVGSTWRLSNTFKGSCLTPLRFKGLVLVEGFSLCAKC